MAGRSRTGRETRLPRVRPRIPAKEPLMTGQPTAPGPAHAETLAACLTGLGGLDRAKAIAVLGLAREGDILIVPFLGHDYRIGLHTIADPAGSPPPFAVCIVLCRLLLHCPGALAEPGSLWTAFRQFPGAAPLCAYFAERVEGALARAFAWQPAALAEACRQLDGTPQPDLPHDLAWTIPLLPRLPALLTFNAAGEGLPASAVLLFPRRAGHLLDMECLVIAAELLARRLQEDQNPGI